MSDAERKEVAALEAQLDDTITAMGADRYMQDTLRYPLRRRDHRRIGRNQAAMSDAELHRHYVRLTLTRVLKRARAMNRAGGAFTDDTVAAWRNAYEIAAGDDAAVVIWRKLGDELVVNYFGRALDFSEIQAALDGAEAR